MNRRNLPKTFIILAIAAAALALSLSGCKDFSFFSELGIKGGLSLSPSEIAVTVNSSVSFKAAGGVPPYSYDMVSGSGSIDAGTGAYTAPADPGEDIVRVTDDAGQSATAAVTVTSGSAVLAVSPSGASVPAGNSITFVVTGGDGPYNYAVQTDNSGGAMVTPAGDYAFEYTAGFTTEVTDRIEVTDSGSPQQSCTVDIDVTSVVTNVDYSVSNVNVSSPAFVGSGISGSFHIDNTGSATGTADISWWLFLSADGTFGGAGEHLVDSGTVSDDISGMGFCEVIPSGSWPIDLSPADYTLFVMISSPDDLTHGDNISAGSSFTLEVPDVDYRVASVANTGGAYVGGALTGEFTLDNAGTHDGSQDVTWKAYVSTNATVDVGDTLIDSNTEGAMTAAEAPRTIPFTGTWPGSAGSYYLVVEVSAADDEAAGNDANNTTATASTIAVDYPDVDYQVTSVLHLSGTGAGAVVDGEFVLENIGTDDGVSTVEWNVYASINTSVDAGDALVASDTESPLTASEAPRTIPFTGTWPADPGSYYLVVKVNAFDETQVGNDTNNTTATASTIAVIVADIDYYADAISAAAGVAGDTLSCTFDLHNSGTDSGVSSVVWNLYVSANTTLDAGDYLATWGTAAALGAGASTTITPSGATWPITPGDYYLIVEIESSEDVAAGKTANDVAVSGSTFHAAAPDVDYMVNSVAFVSAGSTWIPDGAVNGSFVYKNNGTNNGTQPVSWEAYASLDAFVDAGDVLIDSGSGLPPLDAGALSGSISFSGKWPLDYDEYYLVVQLMSSDELNPADNYGATSTPEAVGYFDEEAHETNNDYTNLTDFYDLGVTLKPGMSIEIKGYMSGSDLDDIMAFNTGTCSMITFAVTYSSDKAQIRIYVMDGPNNFIDGVSGTPGAISLNWTVDLAGVQRYLNLDNRGANPAYDGNYSCVITGH
jgi:hypothetical protein